MSHATPIVAGPPLKLSLVAIERDGVIRAAADGAITFDTVMGEKHTLAGLLGENWASMRVLLSMDKVNYIDSAGIGWLISTQKQFRAGGGAFILHSVRPAVRQVLELLKVGRVCPIAENEETARTLAGGQQA